MYKGRMLHCIACIKRDAFCIDAFCIDLRQAYTSFVSHGTNIGKRGRVDREEPVAVQVLSALSSHSLHV